jgi:hypothetical protein
MFGVQMRIRGDDALAILLVPLVAVAVLAALSPAQFLSKLGGPRNRKVPALEIYVRGAGLLLLIGTAITWFQWWKT